MLYRIVRPVATLAFKVFFKHIHVSGLENIPMSGPVLIGSNHPTAFIEPCVIACLQPRTLNFIVRGDIFKKPFYIQLLKSLHLIPIFRFRDGYSSLKNNQETFKYVNEVLKDQRAIFILPEGRTIQEKRLRPIQKGTARMAFGAYEEFKVGTTKIVPIGITYEKADAWRKELIIDCGKPIFLKDFIKTYEENENQGIQELTTALESRMPEHMVIIPDKNDDEIVDLLCLIDQNDHKQDPWPIVINSVDKLKREQKISQHYAELPTDKKEASKKILCEYESVLAKNSLEDIHVSKSSALSFQKILILITGIFLFIPGILFNGPPVYIALLIAKKKVYVKEFYSPVLFALVTFLLLVWYLVWGILGLTMIGWITIPILIGLMLSGYISIIFIETINLVRGKLKYGNLDIGLKTKIKDLRSQLKAYSI